MLDLVQMTLIRLCAAGPAGDNNFMSLLTAIDGSTKISATAKLQCLCQLLHSSASRDILMKTGSCFTNILQAICKDVKEPQKVSLAAFYTQDRCSSPRRNRVSSCRDRNVSIETSEHDAIKLLYIK